MKPINFRTRSEESRRLIIDICERYYFFDQSLSYFLNVNKISKRWLAEKLNYSASLIYKLCTGERSAGLFLIKEINDVLKVNVNNYYIDNVIIRENMNLLNDCNTYEEVELLIKEIIRRNSNNNIVLFKYNSNNINNVLSPLESRGIISNDALEALKIKEAVEQINYNNSIRLNREHIQNYKQIYRDLLRIKDSLSYEERIELINLLSTK